MAQYIRGTGTFEYKYLPGQPSNLHALANRAGAGAVEIMVARREHTRDGLIDLERPAIRTTKAHDADDLIGRFVDRAFDEEQSLAQDADRFARGELISVELVGRARYRIGKRALPGLRAWVNKHLPPDLHVGLAELAEERDAEHDEVDGLGAAGDHLFTHGDDFLPVLALAILAHAARRGLDAVVVEEVEPSFRQHLQLDAVGWELLEKHGLDAVRAVVSRRAHLGLATDHLLLEQFLRKHELYDEAIAAATEAIRCAPRNGLAYLGRGISRHFLRDFEEARADYLHARELHASGSYRLDADEIVVLELNLGELYLDLGVVSAAWAHLERANELAPGDENVVALMARARAAEGLEPG